MKEKQDKFNEDEKLRILAYKRNLAKMTRLWEREEAYNNGFEVGMAERIKKERYERVLKYLQRYYQVEDLSFLDNLTLEEYDEILDMIFERVPLENIIQKIKK